MHDFAVIGGGIVGLSTARALLRRHPGAGVVVLEKEGSWARHQTGHNSGVIHSGVYYKPGSLKARFCREGASALVEYCRQHGIAHEICGKVIVATERREVPLLENLHERGRENGLAVEKIGPGELGEIEPHAAGVAALRVPETGIVDYVGVARAFADEIAEAGGELRAGTRVTGISERDGAVEIGTSRGTVRARTLVNCAGLYSDQIAAMSGVAPPAKIVPFRGEYYELARERRSLVRGLIYPVPNPAFPFLGVHFTRMVEGGVEAGPNAVLGLAREGYRKTDVNPQELAEILGYGAFWRLAAKNWWTGAGEVFRSLSKGAFVRSLRKLVPEVREGDLVPAEAGVRAQALKADGSLVDDFLIVEGERSVHVLNAPSPAATACLPIGESVAERAAEKATKRPTGRRS
ncbi:L-2-hydroxyglutarate oxidase [Rubrobacter marinus]|uniref:L-2-hydroxyglutarate oxidase n=1 Tax=Rubrobacter marinus TaxID=2653852 RepID=A0A6G8Q0J1_9ACTN|nr:L-2-hydroxyglutarate oxidase [Rubrobacter marinus]QIN79948.1 L-2-hydroxyglutarate oxidase [Rubrobacter marinus]